MARRRGPSASSGGWCRVDGVAARPAARRAPRTGATAASTSSGSPEIVISLPRTWMGSVEGDLSMMRRQLVARPEQGDHRVLTGDLDLVRGVRQVGDGDGGVTGWAGAQGGSVVDLGPGGRVRGYRGARAARSGGSAARRGPAGAGAGPGEPARERSHPSHRGLHVRLRAAVVSLGLLVPLGLAAAPATSSAPADGPVRTAAELPDELLAQLPRTAAEAGLAYAPRVVSVHAPSRTERNAVAATGLDVVEHVGHDSVEVVLASADQQQVLDDLGLALRGRDARPGRAGARPHPGRRGLRPGHGRLPAAVGPRHLPHAGRLRRRDRPARRRPPRPRPPHLGRASRSRGAT